MTEFKEAVAAAAAKPPTPFSGVRESNHRWDDPESIVEAWKALVETSEWYHASKEHFVVFLFNVRGGLMGYSLVSIGGLTETIAQARDVLRPAIVAGAFGVAMAHNHPSGDPTPSAADMEATRKIRTASEAMGILCFDHVIIGEKRGRH